MTDEGSIPGPRGIPGGSAADKLWWYQDARQPLPPVRPRRRWRTRREHVADALACLALSTLCFSQASGEVLFLADWNFYKRVPLGAPMVAALLLNIVGLAAAAFLVARVVRRVQRTSWRRLAAVAATAALLIALNYGRIAHDSVGRWTEAIGHSGLLLFAVLGLAASFGWPRQALRVVRGLALTLSPLAVFTLALAPWMFLEVAAGPVWRRVDPAPLNGSPPSLRRVVWLVLEELDQRIAFEARPAGLELPELDRLREEALYADAARPPAGVPEVSIPALVVGRPVVAVAPASPNDLELTFGDGKTARWSTHPNVFSQGRAMGYDTAVIGWLLPYPRVLGASLGAAEWRPSHEHEQTRANTLAQALGNQWGSLLPPVHVRRLYAQTIAELGNLAVRAAANDRFGLVLLHIPLPRGPGVYDRATGRVTAWDFRGTTESYRDNLALADVLVGDLRRAMQRARLDDRTWLIVTSDRWWSEAKRDHGQIDHRVPFLVRPPNGGRPMHVDVTFSTLATHDLVLAILRGSIMNTADAVAWLTRNPASPPRDYTREGLPIY